MASSVYFWGAPQSKYLFSPFFPGTSKSFFDKDVRKDSHVPCRRSPKYCLHVSCPCWSLVKTWCLWWSFQQLAFLQPSSIHTDIAVDWILDGLSLADNLHTVSWPGWRCQNWHIYTPPAFDYLSFHVRLGPASLSDVKIPLNFTPVIRPQIFSNGFALALQLPKEWRWLEFFKLRTISRSYSLHATSQVTGPFPLDPALIASG